MSYSHFTKSIFPSLQVENVTAYHPYTIYLYILPYSHKFNNNSTPRFQIQNFGHKDFEPSKNEKSLPPLAFFLFTFIRGIFACTEQKHIPPIFQLYNLLFLLVLGINLLFFSSASSHPSSKSKILDIRILNPQKMKKVYPPWLFFVYVYQRYFCFV